MYPEITYKGAFFLVLRIEGEKAYIGDVYGNKLGWIYGTEMQFTGKSSILKGRKI